MYASTKESERASVSMFYQWYNIMVGEMKRKRFDMRKYHVLRRESVQRIVPKSTVIGAVSVMNLSF